MRNKQNKRVLISNQRRDIYIVKKISSNFNKVALIVIMQRELFVALSTIDNISNQEQQINQINVNINKTSNNNNIKVKIYNL